MNYSCTAGLELYYFELIAKYHLYKVTIFIIIIIIIFVFIKIEEVHILFLLSLKLISCFAVTGENEKVIFKRQFLQDVNPFSI